MVISEEKFRRYATSRDRMAYTAKCPNFLFFHYFLVPL